MNCEEFQKNLLSEPQAEQDELKHHMETCSACADFANGLYLFDDQLRDALQVTVPASLKDELAPPRISRRSRRGLRGFTFALVFSALFLIGVTMFINLNQYPQLEHQVVTHIEKEPFTLTTAMNPSDEDITATLAALGVDMNQEIGKVHFIKKCFLGDELIAHLVIEGDKGPITVLVMPNTPLVQDRTIESAQLTGVITPINDNMSVAVVGYIGESIYKVRDKTKVAFAQSQ